MAAPLPLAAGLGEDDLALALTEIGGVLLALGLLSRLALRLRMSAVPLFLALGVALGSGPGPLAISEDVAGVGAAIGVALLLFFIGLEYTGEELVTTLRRQGGTGIVDALLNALPGLVVGLAIGLDWTASAALAGITWISSSGIVARTLDDLGRLGNRETPSILSILVIEDLAMAGYLPLLTVALVGGTVAAALGSIALALAVVLAGFAFALYGSRHAARLLAAERDETLLLSVLGLTLLVSGLAEQANVSSAVGAFLVGIAISGQLADRTRATLAPLRDLFAAGFFVFFGLQIDLSGLPGVLGWIVVLVLVGIVGKLAAGWYAAGRAGVAVPGRVRAGTALIARGEFSVIIASLAVGAGADARVGALAAGYVLIVALAGTLLTRYADALARWLPARGRG